MGVTVGGTSITFNDGTVQTTATGGAPTTAQVLSATAGASVGAVGTYAFVGCLVNVGPGGTTAGSNLRYALASSWTEFCGNWNIGSGGAVSPISSAPSGTWRAMGFSSTQSGYRTTLFLRIS